MADLPTRVDPVEGHRLWAAGYDSSLNPLLALERRVLQPHLDNLTGKMVLDVGCGTGRWMVHAQANGATVAGLDFTAEMLAQAAAKPGLEGRLVRADAQFLPVADGAADLTLSSFCLAYVSEPQSIFAELRRVTRPGGRIIVSDIHPAAAAAGWKRTFRSGGQLFEMRLDLPQNRDPLAAGVRSGLTLWRVLEPRFGEAERSFFEQAGREEAYEGATQVPAILVTMWDRAES
jgi:malonyl-CoA O-methyltransferase